MQHHTLFFLDILKLDNIFKLKIGSLVHKLQYNKHETPPALHDLVSLASDVHKHNTRIATGQNFCLRSKRSRTSRTKYRDARRSFRIRDAENGARAKSTREGGGGGERRERLLANPSILKNPERLPFEWNFR